MNVPLSKDSRFLFLAMMQSALKFREMRRSKEFFVDFAAEIWESMLLSDEKELRDTIEDIMMSDLESYVKEGSTQNSDYKAR